MKTCSRCGQMKALDAFPLDRKRVSGRFPYCKTCQRQAEARRRAGWSADEVADHRRRQRTEYATWRSRDPYSAPVIRAESQLRRYGLTPDDYAALLAAQRGTCAFEHCRVRPEDEQHGRLHVDHCHLTGVVRGLLCFAHNAMLGNAADDVVALQDGAVYLALPPATVVFPEGRRPQRGVRRASVRALVSLRPSESGDAELADKVRARVSALKMAPPLF